MTRITDILTVPTSGAYYFDDLQALQSASISESERFTAKPITSGFRKVREPAEALSVGLVLDSGLIAWGDCVSVEFSGAAGRYPVFRSQAAADAIQELLLPQLKNTEIDQFRPAVKILDDLIQTVVEERLIPEREPGEKISRRELFASAGRMLSDSPATEKVTIQRLLHPAVRYGVSQALLQAAAFSRGITLTEVICQEWDLPLPQRMIPLHAQCGSNRYLGAEKMIVRGLTSLPHSLIDNIPKQLGRRAVKLIRYARWLKARIQELGPRDYFPTIHLDLHGGLGKLVDNNPGKILGIISSLEQAVQPYPLRIECPVILESREEHINLYQTLREYIRFRKMRVQLVADEWANTLDDIQAFLDADAADMIQLKLPDLGGLHHAIEAAISCQSHKVDTFWGGSCAETDLSARISTQVALAVQPDLLLAKPGMGIDEGITIVLNEMKRTLAWIQSRFPKA
jgi:methylaspartate ammonia-lyase